MKVLGNRVYLKVPKRPKSKVILSPQEEAEKDRQYAESLDRLEVKYVGEAVEGIKPGNFVFPDPRRVVTAGYHKKISGDMYLIISQHDIMHVW